MYTHHQGTVQCVLIFYTTDREHVLQNIGQNVTVMAGYFNCTLKPKYDRASHKNSANLLRDLVKESCNDNDNDNDNDKSLFSKLRPLLRHIRDTYIYIQIQ